MPRMNTPLKPSITPLVINVDGALLPTNLQLETLWAALAKNFFLTIWSFFTLARHPGRLKHALYNIAAPDVALLPVRPDVLAMAQQAKRDGQPVLLISTACQAQVDAVGQRFGFAGPHLGTTKAKNLGNPDKAARLVERFGVVGFDYIGHGGSDLPVWQQARHITVTAPTKKLWAKALALGKKAQKLGDIWRYRSLVKEMRPHQWVKNILLLLPLLAAHDLSLISHLQVLVAMAAFSLGASAIYFVNDLLDLDSDRQHPEKRFRPIAAGALPIRAASLYSLLLGLMAITLGLAVGWAVAGYIAAYMVFSLLYSLQLKSMRWVDLFVLASLYTLRVLTGSAAANTDISLWLILFIYAVFFTLAGVKRLTGLARAHNNGRLPGRGYSRENLSGLRNMAALGVLAAVLAFASYTFSAEAEMLYSHPVRLRLVVIPMVIWLARMILLSQRGQEDYDPIIFVAHDRLGHLIMATGVLLAILAI